MTVPYPASLDRVRRATDGRDETKWLADEADKEWREAIRAAIADGVPVQHIAQVAGIHRQRVYQIRDGKR